MLRFWLRSKLIYINHNPYELIDDVDLKHCYVSLLKDFGFNSFDLNLGELYL